MKKVLTKKGQELANEYAVRYEDGCSCHINPPCSSCTHPGNQINLVEQEDLWEVIDDDQPPAKPKLKPFCVRVNVELYYEIEAESLPSFANILGVEKLVSEAFEDYNRPWTLQELGEQGVLRREPVEVSIGAILSA
jgi:hypothetical protein